MIPSVKTLDRAFPGKGKEVRELLEGKRKTLDYESVRKWYDACYHKPDLIKRQMVAINEIVEVHGVEAVGVGNFERTTMEYINLEDTYLTPRLGSTGLACGRSNRLPTSLKSQSAVTSTKKRKQGEENGGEKDF